MMGITHKTTAEGPPRHSSAGKRLARSLEPQEIAALLKRLRHQLTVGQICDQRLWRTGA